MTKEELQRALECAERCDHIDGALGWSDVVDSLKAALEAKDEPVAWVRWDEEENYYDVRRTPPPQEAIEYLAKWNRPAWVPAYPTPPQRKPLTDEQIWACLPKNPDEMAFARAIERAHKIKEKNT
jgi:hypothetical protein